ncbi:hypothetical protein Tco_0991468 [Tanacetum coccineum]|uniref:Uncharacterized protein n=1 Tax=Tanacetum coccineum TaxID=301880 RepID=A0ABQ5EZQ0_9ASTR
MATWPIPTNIKHLKGFMGLKSYYRRFMMLNASGVGLGVVLLQEIKDFLPLLVSNDYQIQYRKGVEYVTTDALSRLQHPSELVFIACSSITTELYQTIVESWETDPALQQLIQKLQSGQVRKGSYIWANQQKRRKGKLVVGDNPSLRVVLLKQIHGESVGGCNNR